MSTTRDSIRKILREAKARKVESLTSSKRQLRELDREITEAYGFCQSLKGVDLFSHLRETKTQPPDVSSLLERKRRYIKTMAAMRKHLRDLSEVLDWLTHARAPMPPEASIRSLRTPMELGGLDFHRYVGTPGDQSVFHSRFEQLQSLIDNWHQQEFVKHLVNCGHVEGVDFVYADHDVQWLEPQEDRDPQSSIQDIRDAIKVAIKGHETLIRDLKLQVKRSHRDLGIAQARVRTLEDEVKRGVFYTRLRAGSSTLTEDLLEAPSRLMHHLRDLREIWPSRLRTTRMELGWFKELLRWLTDETATAPDSRLYEYMVWFKCPKVRGYVAPEVAKTVFPSRVQLLQAQLESFDIAFEPYDDHHDYF